MLGSAAIRSTILYARRLSKKGLHRASARHLLSALKNADPAASKAIDEAGLELVQVLFHLGDRRNALIASALLDEIRCRRQDPAPDEFDRALAVAPRAGQ